MKTKYNFDVSKLNGPVVELTGKFGTWEGTITVRPAESQFQDGVTYSGNGKLPLAVADLARRIWRSEIMKAHIDSVAPTVKKALDKLSER